MELSVLVVEPGNTTTHISDKAQDTRVALVMLHEYAHVLLHNAPAQNLSPCTGSGG